MTSLNPGADDRPADRRGARPASRDVAAERRWRVSIELLQLVSIPSAGAPCDAISASAVRRHAPARDDRDGARLQAAPADRRRADHRARRDDPGADPRPDARAEAEDRRGDRAHHARSRRRRRDGGARGRHVCGSQGRGSAGGRPVRAAAASLHARPARFDSEAWRCRGRECELEPQAQAACGNRGHRAVAFRADRRLRVRAALRLYAIERCRIESPPLEEKAAAHFAACWEADRVVAMHE